MGALGLLLSLKHNFIKKASSQDDAIKKSQGMEMNIYYEETCEVEKFKEQAAKETTDELIGIVLVIVGGLLSSYGDSLTTWFNSSSFDRKTIFELTGFISLSISCVLFLFSVPTIEIRAGHMLPDRTNKQEDFAHEFAKHQSNRLLGKYLLVFGLVVLMLAVFI